MFGGVIVVAILLSACFGCKQPVKQEVPQKQEHTFSVKGSVREINIWPETPEFPEHPGKAEFVSYCGICHSLKYITAQPDFPRTIWEHEVSKMVVKYNAPIDSVNCAKIVDYLMKIKGAS